jgi:hypothetical protein
MSDTSRYLRQLLARSAQFTKYQLRLTAWLYKQRWRRLKSFFQKHFDVIRRAALIVTAAAVGIAIDHFGGSSFKPDTLSEYLITVGAMTGATIAIVFTISIFLLQNASDIYSSDYFELYVHDWKEKVVYLTVILITLALFGAGIFAASMSTITERTASVLVIGPLVLVGMTFALIDWQYRLVRQKITPSAAIVFLEKEGTRFIERLQSDARMLASLLQAGDRSVSRDVALAAAYNRFLMPLVARLDRQLENLAEISVRLSDRQETAITKRGLTAVYRILESFLEARSTSSLTVPSAISILAVESDSHAFLTGNCERLNMAGEKFIRENKDELSTHVLHVYRSLAVKAKDIAFLTRPRPAENPTFDLFTSFCHFLIEYAKRANNIEVVFQGTQVLSDLSVITAEMGFGSSLNGLQDKLLSAAMFGIVQKQVIIVERATIAFLRILAALFDGTRTHRPIHVGTSLKNLATIATYHFKILGSGGAGVDFATSMSLTKAYDDLPALLDRIVARSAQMTDAQGDVYRHDLVALFEELNRSLRTLSEDLKNCDSILVDSIGRLVWETNILIVSLMSDPSFAHELTELRRRLTWNIHLPSWFAYHSGPFNGSSPAFRMLCDSVGMTGILVAEKLGDPGILVECVDCLAWLTQHCLDKTTSQYGFDEPRALEKACYLGILGLKKGWKDVVTAVGIKIYEYEPKYHAKYFSRIPAGIDPANHNVIGLPHSDQLVRELWRWRADLERQSWSNVPRIRDDAETVMNELIDPIDIDRFIFDVWGVRLADTEFDGEIKLKLERRRLIRLLQALLGARRKQP